MKGVDAVSPANLIWSVSVWEEDRITRFDGDSINEIS